MYNNKDKCGSQTDFTNSPLTNQGVRKTVVQFRDKITGDYLFQKEVTNAFVAKMYHEQRITHAINGMQVIDI